MYCLWKIPCYVQFLKLQARFFCCRWFQQRREGPFLRPRQHAKYKPAVSTLNARFDQGKFLLHHISFFFSNGLKAKFLIFIKIRQLKKKCNLRIVEYSENTSSPVPVKCVSCNLQRGTSKILTLKTYRR